LSVNYYILVTIDSCQSYSPRKTGLHFSLNAIKASVGGVTDGLFDASDRIEGGGVVVWWNDLEKDEQYSFSFVHILLIELTTFCQFYARWSPSLYNVRVFASLDITWFCSM